MNKMGEIVYAVSRDDLFKKASSQFTGFVSRSRGFPFQEVLNSIIENHVEMTRGDCESNPDFKHIIPYVVLKTEREDYFMTRRTENQTEKRLHNKKSIGVGGHIGPVKDSSLPKDLSFMELIDYGMRRELLEELKVVANDFSYVVPLFEIVKPTLVGLVNDESNPVGSVHLGLVYVATLKTEDMHRVGINETENMTSSWHEFSELEWMDGFESWSEILIDSQLR